MRKTRSTVLFEAGTKVKKNSGKKFKSGLEINTVKSVVEHHYLKEKTTGDPRPAYTFFEDDSIVEAAICLKIDD